MCPDLLIWWIVYVSGLAIFLTGAQSNTCPVFGTDQSSNLTRSTRERVFLNFEAPAQCKGNVTSWRFCHYRSGEGDNAADNNEYGAMFIIYRRETDTSGMYVPVSGSITSKKLPYGNVSDVEFLCLTEMVTQSFEIQENDVIGACVWRRSRGGMANIEPLHLIGDESSINNQNLYWYNRNNYEMCADNQLGSINTADSNDFQLLSGSKLHLYANIDVATFCRVGNNPSATAPSGSASGTYLDTTNAAMCSDHITSWHYCYYPSAAPAGQTYTMTVAAWRLEAGTYLLIQSTNRTISLDPIDTKANIFCVEETLVPGDYVSVSQGDFIGVVLPSTNPIPVVSTDAGSSSSLMKHPQSVGTSDLLGSEFTLVSNSALHVYANLIPVATEQPVTTTLDTSTTSEATLDMSTTLGSEAGVDSAALAASLVVVVIVMIVVGIVIAVVILVVVWKKRKNKFSGAIDNATYHVARDEASNGVKLAKLDQNYDSIAQDYSLPMPQKIASPPGIDQIYESMDKDEDVYCIPIDSMQEHLEAARRGAVPTMDENPYQAPTSDEAAIYAEFKELKIRTIAGFSIQIGDQIGSGQFGTVSEGIWKPSSMQMVQVAVKTLKNEASSLDGLKFLQEAAIMGQFKHPNVVALYGVAQKAGKRMMVVELLSKGDLHNHLNSLKPDPGELVQPSLPHLLLEFSQQIALGMGYLASRGFVHRDLAARNVMLSNNNICKIADFGMSRDLIDTDYYVSSGGKIPVKWTAPEAVHYKKYSTASDMWSYGCVLYEIWSLGTKPFETMGNIEVINVVEAGTRLAPPPGCPKRVYEVMIQSWATVPSERPEFRVMLLSLLENKSLVLEVPPEDLASHPQAGVLGAPLEAGQKMYITAQNTYRH